MQGKEQAAGPRTNVAEGKTGIHGQRFIFTLFSFNLGLDFIKGKIQGKELSESQHERPRRGEHCINPCGCQSSTSAGSVGLGSATAPQTAGWALKAPLHPFTATRASLLSLSSPSLWRGLLTRPASWPRTSISAAHGQPSSGQRGDWWGSN